MTIDKGKGMVMGTNIMKLLDICCYFLGRVVIIYYFFVLQN